MAVPKKKTARSSSKSRHQTYVKKQQKKLLDFVERAKRNERGFNIVAAKKEKDTPDNITKIAA